MAYAISHEDVVGMLNDNRLRPQSPGRYDGMTVEETATEYLRVCAEAPAVCVGCNNPLDDEDREFSGADTNVCLPCACY